MTPRVNKPVAITTLVTALINLAVAFGLNLAPAQVVAVMTATSLIAAAVVNGVTWTEEEARDLATGEEYATQRAKSFSRKL